MKKKFIFVVSLVVLIAVSFGIYQIFKNSGNSITQNNGTAQEITIHELMRHNSVNDCWILVTSSVYDITPFLQNKSNPDYSSDCGTDATKKIIPNTPNNESQKRLNAINQYDIGIIVPGS